MSRTDRLVGLARSMAIYHLIPRRQRQLRTLYSRWLRAGDLVFDIGAHVGNRTRAFAALGCRVVAVEPQPSVAAVLRLLAGRLPAVTVVECAVAEQAGRAMLAVSDRTPTVSTLTPAWREARRRDKSFAGVEWNRDVEVDATTLDALVAQFGVPAFVKLDMEGGELAALRGLTTPVPGVSFEYSRTRSKRRRPAPRGSRHSGPIGSTGRPASRAGWDRTNGSATARSSSDWRRSPPATAM